MTWAKLSDTFIDDPVLLGLPRGVRHLYVEGIVWSCKHETDGRIPRHVLARITDEPEPHEAAGHLVAASLWHATDDGYEVVDFLSNQPRAPGAPVRPRHSHLIGAAAIDGIRIGITRCAIHGNARPVTSSVTE